MTAAATGETQPCDRHPSETVRLVPVIYTGPLGQRREGVLPVGCIECMKDMK